MSRTIFYPTLLFLGSLLMLAACTDTSTPKKEGKSLKREQFKGETMGTTFSIVYLDSNQIEVAADLQDLLLEINQEVSTYIKTSSISQLNQQLDTLVVDSLGHFAQNYTLSKSIHQTTKGWFNPAVMPLVNYWGFGYTEKKMVTELDSSQVDSLLNLVQFDAFQVQAHPQGLQIVKSLTRASLDFSAIAKGYAVDAVGRYLESKGVEHYFVEIGGEVRARGATISGKPWRTGIRTPQEGAATNSLQVGVELSNLSLATSGNYENFYEDPNTGFKYAHTINPHTGYPERNSLLSASVFSADCATADAFATAFMSMGLEKALEIVAQQPELKAYFIYSDAQGQLQVQYTEGVAQYLLQ